MKYENRSFQHNSKRKIHQIQSKINATLKPIKGCQIGYPSSLGEEEITALQKNNFLIIGVVGRIKI